MVTKLRLEKYFLKQERKKIFPNAVPRCGYTYKLKRKTQIRLRKIPYKPSPVCVSVSPSLNHHLPRPSKNCLERNARKEKCAMGERKKRGNRVEDGKKW